MQKFVLFVLCSLMATAVYASGGHVDPVTPILLGLVVILFAAKLGAYIAVKIHQPPVLGELVAGIIIGNLMLVGFDGFEFIKDHKSFEVLAGIGVVLLLFEVGLESSLGELIKVGFSATLVAVIGVVLPFFLGWWTSSLLLPDKSEYVHAFVGATLCATSVGITARVLKDLKKIASPEAKIILGAAVIDDVLGLIILAVVSGVIASAAATGDGTISFTDISWITLKAVGFLLGALLIGVRVAPHVFRFGARMQVEGMLLAISLVFCFMLAYLANLMGLATIVGAFAAGLIIDGTGFARFFGDGEPSIDDLIIPVSRFFVPIFFVTMGMKVEIQSFLDLRVLTLAAVITVAAIAGKQICSLAVVSKGLNRVAIGIGMVPRGEVGLIFAAIGSELTLGGERIIGPTLFSAIVVMVAVTTMVTPPALKWALHRK